MQCLPDRLVGCVLLGLCAGLAACASIPKHQYGIARVSFGGMHALAPEALAVCLATQERAELTLRLGFSAPSCDEPPFDSVAPKLELWSWPWTTWPVYDPAIFAVDRQRMLRWYKARGFYGARIMNVRTTAGGRPVDTGECPAGAGSCHLHIHIQIEEGPAVHVSELRMDVHDGMADALLSRLRDQLSLQPGERFDEARYSADKAQLASALEEASYTRAQVSGRVVIDRAKRTAQITYTIEPGPRCVFGTLTVEGAQGLPRTAIIQAAAIPKGAPFRRAQVEDAQRAIFALGVFSAVRVEARGTGRVVDLVATLQRARVANWQAGVGVLSGSLLRVTSDETYSVPQWDIHMSGSYENKNFLGGLRQLRLEDRPALIFLKNFPGIPAGGPRLGNVLSARFLQPGFVEARTNLILTGSWDLGPDPFRGFFRNDLAVKLTLERTFFRHVLTTRVAAEHDLYYLLNPSTAPTDVTDYRLPFLEQQLIFDYRDNPGRPRKGAYVGLIVQEAFRLGSYGSWNYVRLLPDVRGYLPVIWDIVLAARFMVGALLVSSAAPQLPASAALLGPQAYRLRGGGANGNRGFTPGTLGDSREGGTRRWLGSLELRIPLGGSFGFVLFGDAGDVHRQPTFRFSHLNTSVGLGLRYYSLLGAIRLDAGWRVPGWQRIGGGPQPQLHSSLLPSALQLTIGEAF